MGKRNRTEKESSIGLEELEPRDSWTGQPRERAPERVSQEGMRGFEDPGDERWHPRQGVQEHWNIPTPQGGAYSRQLTDSAKERRRGKVEKYWKDLQSQLGLDRRFELDQDQRVIETRDALEKAQADLARARTAHQQGVRELHLAQAATEAAVERGAGQAELDSLCAREGGLKQRVRPLEHGVSAAKARVRKAIQDQCAAELEYCTAFDRQALALRPKAEQRLAEARERVLEAEDALRAFDKAGKRPSKDLHGADPYVAARAELDALDRDEDGR